MVVEVEVVVVVVSFKLNRSLEQTSALLLQNVLKDQLG